jgi:hypothetical protein
MNTQDTLDEVKWTRPSEYHGFSPDGDYLIYSQTRDSSILSEVNYELIFSELKRLDKENAYDFRASHWACGWIEYILIKKDSPQPLKDKAAEIIQSLSDYPILDDQVYSDTQYDAMFKYWKEESLHGRIDYIHETSTVVQPNIFAARNDDEIPEDVLNDWQQSEIFY